MKSFLNLCCMNQLQVVTHLLSFFVNARVDYVIKFHRVAFNVFKKAPCTVSKAQLLRSENTSWPKCSGAANFSLNTAQTYVHAFIRCIRPQSVLFLLHWACEPTSMSTAAQRSLCRTDWRLNHSVSLALATNCMPIIQHDAYSKNLPICQVPTSIQAGLWLFPSGQAFVCKTLYTEIVLPYHCIF